MLIKIAELCNSRVIGAACGINLHSYLVELSRLSDSSALDPGFGEGGFWKDKGGFVCGVAD